MAKIQTRRCIDLSAAGHAKIKAIAKQRGVPMAKVVEDIIRSLPAPKAAP